MGLSEQAAVFEEGFPEVGSMTNSAGGFAGLLADCVEVFAHELCQVGAGQVAPEVFHRVELWGIGWQVLDGQPTRLAGDPLLNSGATVCGQSIPQQDRLSSPKMLLEHLEVCQHLRLLYGPHLESQAQPNMFSLRRGNQAGDGRQTLPVERRDQDWRLAARGPRSANTGPLRKPAFIQENQQRSALAGLFLICGQRYRTQRRIASSLRSRALRCGRWQLQPS